MEDRVPILAFNVKDVQSLKVGNLLDKKYNIAIRAGLHCAPMFHKMAGTMKQGAVRVSPDFSIQRRMHPSL
jgi:selenocysteine lyase/cysteine desulfurase